MSDCCPFDWKGFDEALYEVFETLHVYRVGMDCVQICTREDLRVLKVGQSLFGPALGAEGGEHRDPPGATLSGGVADGHGGVDRGR